MTETLGFSSGSREISMLRFLTGMEKNCVATTPHDTWNEINQCLRLLYESIPYNMIARLFICSAVPNVI